ncbi:hypothetical protein LCGC14_2954030, partial [marine sediment metagenome]
MWRIMQTTFGGPSEAPEKQGNCFMACVCSLLHVSLERAPRLNMSTDEWLEVAQRFVSEQNHWLLFLPAEWADALGPDNVLGLMPGLLTGTPLFGARLQAVAKTLGEDIDDVTAVILDRDRHTEIVKECREVGARIRLIPDGDVAGA